MDNGVYQLTLIPLTGWQNIEVVTTEGLHPEAKTSMVLNAKAHHEASEGPKWYITLMLWKKSGERWTEEELDPIKDIRYWDHGKGLTLRLNDGQEKNISFNESK
ncbi:hypothetical protein [Olivibacter sp. XZL3]|uniref:hypothetical protein n=1 Tax=Olivibacter sp. XZL3 TaxID=1735116 RepID=UPI001066DF21|nr:hypothetical protein [Olivibacter sp. XZL3]